MKNQTYIIQLTNNKGEKYRLCRDNKMRKNTKNPWLMTLQIAKTFYNWGKTTLFEGETINIIDTKNTLEEKEWEIIK